MRNKKSLLSLGLVVLVLILGVGYAVVSNVALTIGGTASVGDSELKVSFEGTTTPSNATKVDAKATQGAKTASIIVTGLTLNETVWAEYTVQNEETEIDAEIIKATITNNKEDFFTVTTDVDTTAKDITAGGTTTVRVSVTLDHTPVTTDDSTANITVELTAKPKQS